MGKIKFLGEQAMRLEVVADHQKHQFHTAAQGPDIVIYKSLRATVGMKQGRAHFQIFPSISTKSGGP